MYVMVQWLFPKGSRKGLASRVVTVSASRGSTVRLSKTLPSMADVPTQTLVPSGLSDFSGCVASKHTSVDFRWISCV